MPRLIDLRRIAPLPLVVIGVIVGLALLTFVADAEPWQPVPPIAAVPPPACEPDDDLVWRHESGATIDPGSTTLLATNAGLHSCAPSHGTLALTLRGTIAEGIGTRAVLVQGTERLLEIELRDEERDFAVDIPAAGALVLAFVNDRYVPPEDRNLWVSGLEFTPRAP